MAITAPPNCAVKNRDENRAQNTWRMPESGVSLSHFYWRTRTIHQNAGVSRRTGRASIPADSMDKPSAAGSVRADVGRSLALPHRRPVAVGDAQFVYDADGQVRLDPDTSIQTSIRQLFSTFRRTGSAVATVKEFREQGLQLPRRISHGPNKGDVVWNELQHSRVLWILHHPRYAGAFCFGRTHIRLHPDGHLRQTRARRYHQRSLRTVPDYLCQARRIQRGQPRLLEWR